MMTLARGMSGDDVVVLQQRLAAAGLLGGTPDGQFDDATQQAVVEAQRRANLPQTGVVEDSTWAALGLRTETTDLAVTTPAAPPQPQAPTRGALLFAGLLFGGIYWYTHRHEAAAFEEDDEDEDDEEDESGFVPPAARSAAVGDYEDAVTDSLLDEPATISASGRPGDCKKAAMRLFRVQSLAQRPNERALYDRVVRKVASNCRGAEEALEEAVEEAAQLREEAEEAVGAKLIRSAHDIAPGTSHEHGFRKSKKKLTKKTITEGRPEGVRGRGRRGASAIEVRRGGKRSHGLRKEKSKTKRGYTWRRED